MKKIIITIFVCLATISAMAQGNDTTINKSTYIINEFHRVVNKSSANIIVNKGNICTIAFLCDDSTRNSIANFVKDGTLEISNNDKSSSSSQFCKIEISTPYLSEFINEGVGKIQIYYTSENIVKITNSGVGNCIVSADCPAISIENSGVGVIKVSGSSADTRIYNSGAGSIQAKNLISDRASVNNCGVGNVEVYADSAINVVNTGLGKVTVYGSPKQQSINSNNGDVSTYIAPANERKKKVRRVYPYIGAKWGFNNYLENGKFAQGKQKVKPWGSWEAGIYIGSSFRFGKWFRLPAEISFTWFNFKFSEPSVRYATDSLRNSYLYYDNNPDITYTKSKLSAPYINLELCPSFVIIPTHLSIGVGGYVGYNLGGRNKYKYLTNGEKYKDHIKASCFEAFRYGVKAEVNLRFISFYATYDLSNVYCNLTTDNNVLKVNPICFGIELTFAR